MKFQKHLADNKLGQSYLEKMEIFHLSKVILDKKVVVNNVFHLIRVISICHCWVAFIILYDISYIN